MGYTKPPQSQVERYFTKFKCVKCDNVEDDKFNFYECCKVCGNNSKSFWERFYPVVGYWKTIKVPVRRKFLCFWWIGYKKERVFVKCR